MPPVEELPQLDVAGVCLNQLLPAVYAAGEAIMTVKLGELEIQQKADSSPVTAADMASNAILLSALERFNPDIPVISEEESDSHKREASNTYFLVDPLDGTREFIRADSKGNFTVNIGLIENGKAVGGIVYAPMRKLLFWGSAGEASYLATPDHIHKLSISQPAAERLDSFPVAIASRSHPDQQTADFLQAQGITQRLSVGSSVKFGYLAMGVADIYPRYGPTMEWDTAAGEAVLRGAGGQVFDAFGKPHRYGKPGWRNDAFIACGQFSPF